MKMLYLMPMLKFAPRRLDRQPEMDIVMVDHLQNGEYLRDGEQGSLAITYELVVNALLRLAPKSGKALDVCCGSASLLCRIAKSMPDMDFLGTDLSLNMLQFAEEQRQKYGLTNLRFRQADMYRLTEAVEPGFDLITWHFAMHHARDADAVVEVLDQLGGLLKPGGTLFVFDINRPRTEKLALLAADVFNRRQGDWYYQDSLDSYKAAFSYEEVQQILSRSTLGKVQHVQPLVGNLFQAFYISSVSDVNANQSSSLRYFWQKADYFLLKSMFRSLPLAQGKVIRRDSGRPSSRPGHGRIIDQAVIDILGVATRAMSPYNIQPWRFRVDGTQIFVHFIRHKNFFLKLEGVYYLTMGHLLENMVAGAESIGYRAEYEILSDAISADVPTLKVRFENVHAAPVDATHVVERTSNRSHYSSERMSEQVKREILALSGSDNISIRFFDDSGKDALCDILTSLENIRFGNSKLCQEGLAFVDFDTEVNRHHGDRLDANSLGLSRAAISILRTAKRFPVLLKLLTHSGLLALFFPLFARPATLLQRSGTLVSFSLKERDFRSYIELGRVVQAVANKLAQHGLASMPLLSGLYLMDVLGENPEIFSHDAKRRISKAAVEMEALFHAEGQRVSYFMRAGYPEKMPPRTIRRSVHDLIYGPDERIEF